MDPHLPLPVLLSQVLIAYTVEFDNEFELRLTGGAGRPRVFLTSLPMWSNYMRNVAADGVRVGDLAALARDSDAAIASRLGGLERWGYVRVTKDPGDARPQPPRRDWIVRPTPNGRLAQDTWAPLAAEIDQRWRARFGEDAIARLRARLEAISNTTTDLPQYLPVVTSANGMFSELVPPTHPPERLELPIFALVAKVLLAFTLEYEADADLSLPVAANVVRVLDTTPQRVADLPRRAGVSKEAISMVMTGLTKHGHVVIEPDPAASRGKVARLTAKGELAQAAHGQYIETVEDRWHARFGRNDIDALRELLGELVGSGDLAHSPLAAGLVPPPSGWRAKVKAPEVLPHQPMVLHRGGWPDGS